MIGRAIAMAGHSRVLIRGFAHWEADTHARTEFTGYGSTTEQFDQKIITKMEAAVGSRGPWLLGNIFRPLVSLCIHPTCRATVGSRKSLPSGYAWNCGLSDFPRTLPLILPDGGGSRRFLLNSRLAPFREAPRPPKAKPERVTPSGGQPFPRQVLTT
jgi:hypothetical protein